jgi:fatty acid desaturase
LNHKEFLSQLAPEDKQALTQKSNWAGLKHLAAYVSLQAILICAILAKSPFWPLLMLPLGILHVFLFTLQHECTHATPFKHPRLNNIVGHICGLVIVQPFLWFRYFHLAHHKHTNIPGRDPELEGQQKPQTWLEFAHHLSTVSYWAAKIDTLWTNAKGQDFASYVPSSARPSLKREARVMIAVYTAVVLLAIMFHATWLLWIWIVPIVIGFPFLRLYLLAEHGRCPQVVNMFDNTRTVFTTRLTRFLAWNMPYHTEHHVYPSVPFHNLPQLHTVMQAHLQNTSHGYGQFTKDYVTHLTDTKAQPTP